MSNEFLLEVGCEEIPARAMTPVLSELDRKLDSFFRTSNLSFASIETLGTARRLVAVVRGLDERQKSEKVTTLGPPEKIAFDKDGRPSRALEGFARKANVDISELRVHETDRGNYMGFDSVSEGLSTPDLIATGIPPLVRSLSFPKTMYWFDPAERFARPVRWVVAIFGGSVVPFELYGVASGSNTSGHRVLGAPSVPVTDYEDLVEQLERNSVIVSQTARRAKIVEELAGHSAGLGGRIVPDEDLLEEVGFINEYPTVVVGNFDERFLQLPREVSTTVMREHQKYFAVESPAGDLLPYFLGVMNTRTDERGLIRKGHERVLKARLSDALFFWEGDSARRLADRVPELEAVTFHQKLGSYRDKVDRMERLAPVVNEVTRAGVDASVISESVRWSKSDLITDLVGEFANLQGIAGGLYARNEGASEAVWKAIYDQYRPAGLDDRLPETPGGVVLGLTDRLDTLFGCFSVGLIPKGSADPLALRRHTQGVIKILVDRRMSFSLRRVIEADGRLDEAVAAQFLGFFADRLRFILGRMGFDYDEINAVLAIGCDDPGDVLARVEALHAVRESPDLIAVSASFKRIKNILKQSEVLPEPVDWSGMEPEEAALAQLVETLEPRIRAMAESGAYRDALNEVAAVRPVVDRFFEKILVNHEDRAIRWRRVSMLKQLFEIFMYIADMSEVVVDS